MNTRFLKKIHSLAHCHTTAKDQDLGALILCSCLLLQGYQSRGSFLRRAMASLERSSSIGSVERVSETGSDEVRAQHLLAHRWDGRPAVRLSEGLP